MSLDAARLAECHALLLRIAETGRIEGRPVVGSARLAARQLLIRHGILQPQEAEAEQLQDAPKVADVTYRGPGY